MVRKMFPLSLRVYLYIGVVAAFILSNGFMHHHGIQEGLARQRAADAAALESARVAAEKKEEEWKKRYETANIAYHLESAANHDQPSIQPIRVCRPATSTGTLPTATTAPRGPAAITGSLPQSDGLPEQGLNLGPSLELLARSADAVVAMCRRLDEDVRAP